MHESPVARDLLRVALDSSRGRRITSIHIKLGPEGGYVPESLEAHILAAAIGTSADGAKITVTSVLTGGAELVSVNVEDRD